MDTLTLLAPDMVDSKMKRETLVYTFKHIMRTTLAQRSQFAFSHRPVFPCGITHTHTMHETHKPKMDK